MDYIVFELANGQRITYPASASKKFLNAQRKYLTAKHGAVKEIVQTIGA